MSRFFAVDVMTGMPALETNNGVEKVSKNKFLPF